MKTVCLDCNKIIDNTFCIHCSNKNTFLIGNNTELKEIEDSLTDYFLQEFNINK